MTSWFRSWHGAPTDNKWLAIAKRSGLSAGIVSAIVWALLDYASQNDERGSINGFDIESYSAFSGFEETEIGAVINALDEKGLLADSCFVSWDKRQPAREDLGATKRKQKQREKEMSRNVTQCHAPDTDTDTERKNTPQPPKGEVVIPSCIPMEAWEAYCKHRGKKFTGNAKRIALGKLEEWHSSGHDPTEIINQTIMNGWKGLFEPKNKGITNARKPTADDALRNVLSRISGADSPSGSPMLCGTGHLRQDTGAVGNTDVSDDRGFEGPGYFAGNGSIQDLEAEEIEDPDTGGYSGIAAE